jgi:hypothetical protein
MDKYGLTRACHGIATAEGQQAAPQVRFAAWFLATILTLFTGHYALAQDSDPSAAESRIKSRFERPNVSKSTPSAVTAAGIRQPDFAAPIGGVVPERDPDREPASEGIAGSGRQREQASTSKNSNLSASSTANASPASAPPATWSSLWRKVFASSSTSPTPPQQPLPPTPAGETAEGTAPSTSGNDTNRLASHTVSVAEGLLEKVTESPNSNAAKQLDAPASEAAPTAPAEPHTPRLFKLAETVVDSGTRSGVFGLSRQMAMKSDQPMVTESLSNGAPAAAMPRNRYSLDDSPLLQPFKATNAPSQASRGNANHGYSPSTNDGSQRTYGSPFGSLGGQLTMSSSTNYRTLAESVANAPMLSEQSGE